MLPHPSCALLASLDDGGELLLWECCFPTHRLGSAPSWDTTEGSALASAESGAIHQLARLPGTFQAAAWLSIAAAAVVAAEPSGLTVFCRAPDGRWLQGAKLVAPGETETGESGSWLSLHAFASVVPDTEPARALQSECSGFALRADGWLGLWRVSLQAEAVQVSTFVWVGQGEISGATCATPLVRPAC